MKNPYLDEAGPHLRAFNSYVTRLRLVKKYAWAIPSEEAIRTIAKYGPIVEIGAGTGYWASLISQFTDIVCYDKHPARMSAWFPVKKGDEADVLAHANRSLFLCWPPYNEKMAYETLSVYEGHYFIYVGEGQGGCTGCGQFHTLLRERWEKIETIGIPTWQGIGDFLAIYQRRVSAKQD